MCKDTRNHFIFVAPTVRVRRARWAVACSGQFVLWRRCPGSPHIEQPRPLAFLGLPTRKPWEAAGALPQIVRLNCGDGKGATAKRWPPSTKNGSPHPHL